MEIAIQFWALILAACGYAVMFGGWEGRCATAILVVASIATALSNKWFHVHWHETNISVFVIDIATFAALYMVAAASHRWWPIWMAAFQFNSVAGHVATMISPEFKNLVYQGYSGLWAIPCVLVMVYGIWRDRVGKFRYEFI